jgi:phosphoribulokinase
MLSSIRGGRELAVDPAALLPTMLAVAGVSSAGTALLARGLVAVLESEGAARLATDDYRRFPRGDEPPGVSALRPDGSHGAVLAQHLALLRSGRAILKPTYDEGGRVFGPPIYMEPCPFIVAHGARAFALPELVRVFDLRVYLDGGEESDADASAYVLPQRHAADVVVSFAVADGLGARVLLRGAISADLAGIPELASAGVEGEDGLELVVPGDVDLPEVGWLEESLWRRMGLLEDGGRSGPLAVVQLLILYHLTSCALGMNHRESAND